ncbi:hypothetical protein [Bacteroides sp. 224]|uniref:hypothetical protein n=1 Tax=Bacteroides sp. 224 TaxID=2302936 RepID=UPI0013D1669E|nr:hypothetical protein [Bacteroides sp. 224]NDV63927.1 hypothetical protein [Bacteroides sp. 224]
MTEQEKNLSVFDIFSQAQETFEEAKKKSASESGSRTKHFRMTADGTYSVRILPLAPVIDQDGKALPMERKGYEYPIKDMVLKIMGKDNKGKEKPVYVNICNANYAFPDLKCDLVDEYVSVASEKYSDDEALIKKIKESSFNGGLKWNSNRCMYILDADKRADGMQILGLSYSQYKDLEDRKIKLWEKLLKKGKAPCPISSIENAYLVEITRKTEKKKTEYSFNIDAVSDTDILSDDELQSLLDAPRLPEALYRYTRFHLEATIAFLKQFDEKLQIDVMSEERIANCIDKIKMTLPADDNSHFTFDGSASDAVTQTGGNGIDALWDAFDRLEENGLDDKSEEGQDLRADIKEFIEVNDLEVVFSRKKTNLDLLKEIEDVLGEDDGQQDNQPAPAAEPEPEGSDEEPENEPEQEPEPERPSRSARGRRNEDTNEPAERPGRTDRRSARPERKRR